MGNCLQMHKYIPIPSSDQTIMHTSDTEIHTKKKIPEIALQAGIETIEDISDNDI